MWRKVLSVVAATIIAVSLSRPAGKHESYDKWKQTFGQTFSRVEDEYRRMIFESNEKEVEEFNSLSESYQKGINQFSHMTDEEFLEMFSRPIRAVN